MPGQHPAVLSINEGKLGDDASMDARLLPGLASMGGTEDHGRSPICAGYSYPCIGSRQELGNNLHPGGWGKLLGCHVLPMATPISGAHNTALVSQGPSDLSIEHEDGRDGPKRARAGVWSTQAIMMCMGQDHDE